MLGVQDALFSTRLRTRLEEWAGERRGPFLLFGSFASVTKKIALTGARAPGVSECREVSPRVRSVNAIGRWSSPVEGSVVGPLRFAFDLQRLAWGFGRLGSWSLAGE